MLLCDVVSEKALHSVQLRPLLRFLDGLAAAWHFGLDNPRMLMARNWRSQVTEIDPGASVPAYLVEAKKAAA